jgi:malonyl-CoA decarboxylase
MKEGKDRERPKRTTDLLKAFQLLGKADTEEGKVFQEIKSLYEALDINEKGILFRELIEKVEIPRKELEPLLEGLAASGTGEADWPVWLSRLRGRLYSPRLNIFRRISHSPGGLKFLLDFRRDLLLAQRLFNIDLKALDFDIVLLFELWFQDGFLYLEEISLDSSYRQIERIKNSDLVHPMVSIEEMGQRLGGDRRCFALYHRIIPFAPIMFIEVALTKGIVTNIFEIIRGDSDQIREGVADTAIFYSINNTQQGLAGLGLGRMLIGQVVDYLKKEGPQIKTFATLSPLPGFWGYYLRPLLEGRGEGFSLNPEDVTSFFSKKQIAGITAKANLHQEKVGSFPEALLDILSDEKWADDEELRKALRAPLTKIAYRYIAREKNLQNKPLNPVANFHLGNGATVTPRNVNFLANPSPRGLKESCGLMVNYIYTSSWLGQIRRSFQWFDKLEIKGLFAKRQ